MKLLRVGTRVKCAVCETQVLVLRTIASEVELTCGGIEMVGTDDPRTSQVHATAAGGAALVGKRYGNSADTIELLCTKSGTGAIAVSGEVLVLKQAKTLPATD